MSDTTTWHILVVDDDTEFCKQVKEYLEEENITTRTDGQDPNESESTSASMQVETVTDFSFALELMAARRFDIVILDVRHGPHSVPNGEDELGIQVLKDVQARCFVPIVFYTALPHLVGDLTSPFVRIVAKTGDLSTLLDSIQDIFAIGIPRLNRALVRYMENVQREYMWSFVAQHWEQFSGTADRSDIAYLLARRLAVSLSGPLIAELVRGLGGSDGASTSDGEVHPMQYYLLPPIHPSPLAGDLYRGEIGDQGGYWVLLTPSCDMVSGRAKAEWLLLAFCLRLDEQVEYTKWHEGLPQPSNPVTDGLKSLLRNDRKGKGIQPERFYFLPGALAMPDLVVDFQQLTALPFAQLESLCRLASLDSPFAEALLARFARYLGRLGTPDLNTNLLITRLTPVQK